MKYLKKKLKDNKTSFGTFISLGSPIVTEMIGLTGFDFVIIDLEHGIGNEKDILGQLQALESGSTAPIVRVECSEKQRVHRVLDLGAEGIMFPRLKNAEEVKKAVDALYYPPSGSRGVAKMIRGSNYGSNFDNYYANQENNIIGVIQIETIEILESLNDVAAIDGVDVLFVGPMDLSMAMGIFGQFDNPKFLDALKATNEAAQANNKTCGILLPNINLLDTFYDLGYRFFTSGGDMGFINAGSQNTLKMLQEQIAKRVS